MLKSGALWSLGTMSGTSLDGVDAAMVQTDGTRILAFGQTGYRAYSDGERAVLRAALGCWPGEPAVVDAAEVVETAHAALLAGISGADLVGFHGQTLAHEPAGRGTHQAGDGGILAAALGLPVVWDFRTADVRLGGQGAPLAPFYHHACARWMDSDGPIAFLNLGGVGNLTWVDPRITDPAAPGACLAFDTGPANAPLNDLLCQRRGVDCDAGGALAAQGRVEPSVVARLLSQAYFMKMPPKSLDRNDFGWLLAAVGGLSDADAAATLTAAAVQSAVRGMEHFPAPPRKLLVTGGGRHNATMMDMIADATSIPVAPVEEAGLDGDMLEAQAFAYLAVRVMRGLPTSCSTTTGVAAAVGGGQISYPRTDR